MVGADGVQPWPKILVIDPDLETLASFRTTLEIEGYTTLIASSGHAGQVAFVNCQPDCVLLAVHLPDVDGLEVCRSLRTLPGGRDTPIIMLTARPELDTCDEALLAGCDDVLLTPSPSQLLRHVRAALKLRHLCGQLREHCAQLRVQRNELVRLQQQNERWTSFMFDDLTTQVRALDQHSQRVLRCQQLPESVLESVEQICERARALKRLALSLLDISKSEEGRLVPRSVPVDLQALVSEVHGAAEVTARKRGLSIVEDIEVTWLSADPDLLSRVLGNLLDNALGRAPTGSTIHITARHGDGHCVELRVSDADPQITAELSQAGFERLEHANSLRPGSGGALGLKFCQLAISAHGGSIHVEHASPGAVFCVRLPSSIGGRTARTASA